MVQTGLRDFLPLDALSWAHAWLLLKVLPSRYQLITGVGPFHLLVMSIDHHAQLVKLRQDMLAAKHLRLV